MNRPHLPRPALGLVAIACACSGGESADPGRVTVHRLNSAEYDNTVRDLFGTSLRPAADFPADDRGYGFDNVADALSLSPLLASVVVRTFAWIVIRRVYDL